ncbi:MAG: FAD-binding oxidoreductase, partial [Actinomycetota bacterium]|nr:FAD-binding oxidoreductase [Actinomycetota bacterium]
RVAASAVPPVLAIDVDDRTPIEDLLVRLDWACTSTLTYAISCLQHRITDSVLDDHHAVPSVASDADSLDGLLRGRVVRPGDEDWDQARSAWNLAVDQRPLMVAEVSDAFDVQSVVRYAAEYGLRVAPQSTGHNARPLGDLSDAILLRTGRMHEVTVDADQQSVRVGAGAIWEDVTAALAPHGLAALAGSSPDVGVAGYALGGGYSWLGRSRGLAASSITAVELVTGDGLFHRVDAEHEPELFWAVRGGGANVGVVCAMELEVFPIPEVYGGGLLFPITRAAEVLPAYVEWTRGLPEVATTCVRLLRLPPWPELPEPLRGNAFVMIDGAIDADASEAEQLLAPLRALGPAIDTWGTMPTAGLAMIHLDPPTPVPANGDGLSLTDLTPEVIEVLLAHAGPDVESTLLAVDVRHLGGALGRPDPRGGAVDQLDGGFALFAVGITPTPEAHIAVAADVEALIGALEPHAAAHDYVNFCERSVPIERIYPARELERMRRVRWGMDPRGVLAAAHPIG